MSEPILFYCNPQSRSRIVRWALEEVAAPYEDHVLEYGTTMKSPEYLAINPMGKVPAIVHRGKTVTECAAICAYLADVFPDAQLAPPLSDRADYYRWLFFAAGPLEAAITNRRLGMAVSADQERMVGYGNYDTCVNTLVLGLETTPYLGGEQFSAADIYVGSHVGWGLQFQTLPQHSALQAYWDRLKDRPALKRATEMDAGQINE